MVDHLRPNIDLFFWPAGEGDLCLRRGGTADGIPANDGVWGAICLRQGREHDGKGPDRHGRCGDNAGDEVQQGQPAHQHGQRPGQNRLQVRQERKHG